MEEIGHIIKGDSMIKNRKIKTLMLGLLGVLMLSMVQLPKAQAADSCFVTTPYQEIIWSDPLHSDVFYVRVGSTCKIKLYDMDISFANIDGVEGLIPIHSDNNDSLSNVEDIGRELRMKWSGSEDEQEGVDYVEFSPEDSGDDLFGYWYVVPMPSLNPPATFKRNLPITINSAHYEVDGEMREVKNLVLDSVLTKAPDSNKDTLMISGVEKQDVTYTGQPVALAGELEVEENDDGITAADLTEKYYIYDDSDLSFTPIERPTDPGEFYLVEYSFENDNYRASLRVPFKINDYVTVSTSVWAGHGVVSAPQYVDKGGNLHVDITPADGYEVAWVKHNDDDVTELLNEDNSLDIENVNENAEIVVAFRRVYQITNGDGGEYVKGSGEDLAFVVDKEPYSYTEGEVVIIVDDDYVDLENDSVVRPEAQTITLLGDYLDTLTVGVHSIEIYFFDTGFGGIARGSFTVVEATNNESSESTDVEDDSELVVPNTGQFSSESGSSIEAIGAAVLVGVVTSGFGFILIRKMMRRSK